MSNSLQKLSGFSPELNANISEILALLLREDVDDTELLRLVECHEKILLNTLEFAFDAEKKTEFVTIALASNDELVRLVEEKKAETKLQLSNFIRGQKALKNYK